MRKEKELNKSIGSKSLYPFVQRLLVPSVRQQVAKPQVLMRSQQNCSKEEERWYWTECTEYVWRSGKLEKGRNFIGAGARQRVSEQRKKRKPERRGMSLAMSAPPGERHRDCTADTRSCTTTPSARN